MLSCIFVSHPLFGDDGEIDHLMGKFENVCFFRYDNAQKDRSWCNPIKILITYYLRFYRFVLYLSDVMMLSKFLDASSRESRTSGSLAGSPAIQRSLGAFKSMFFLSSEL